MHSPAVVLLKDVGMNIHLCAYVCVCVFVVLKRKICTTDA